MPNRYSESGGDTTMPPPPGRPPKPILFGESRPRDRSVRSDSGVASLFRSSNNSNGNMDSTIASEASRQSLRRDLQKKRSSLTRPEQSFLEELCMHGNEIEVTLAREKLLDDSIFFVPDNNNTRPRRSVSEGGEIGWNSETFCVGNELSASFQSSTLSSPSEAEIPSMIEMASSTGADSLGSERRQEMLKIRKKNLWYGKMWRAHESGLAVSQTGSRRSVLKRQTSLGNSSSNTSNFSKQKLLFHDEIFRNRGRGGLMMKDSQSDNVRRPASGKKFAVPVRRATLAGLSPPSRQLRRMQSEGSRKSVTFGELPPNHRGSSGESSSSFFKFIRKAAPLRSESMSSIPSIHHAHHIHSPSVTSVGSVPSLSLHHAHHVHSSQSFRSTSVASSVSSMGMDEGSTAAKEEVDYAASREEKKGSEDDNSSIPTNVKIQPLPANKSFLRPVLMRDASENRYMGQGVEVTDWESLQQQRTNLQADRQHAANTSTTSPSASRMESLLSFGDATTDSLVGVRSRNHSFDETMSFGRVSSIFRRTIARSLSDEEMAGIFLGGSKLLLRETSSVKEIIPYDGVDSWKMDEDDDLDYYDSWKVIEDEYENGYGGGGTLPFVILGTSADDVDAHPHVLSPPLMESLLSFAPNNGDGENFWMKFSLVRDGATLHTFLQYARGAKYSFLAIETVDGEVFGAFTTEPWRKNWNYFGGPESFLWKMKHSRLEKCHSIIDQAHMESEIEVYPYTGENNCIQLCTHDKLAVGGGLGTVHKKASHDDVNENDDDNNNNNNADVKEHEWGFGLTIEGDLLRGTTSPCITFGSPSLSTVHSDGSAFEIINLELWTLTPCTKLEEAEKLELGKLFLERIRAK